jgi:hypothetical protein
MTDRIFSLALREEQAAAVTEKDREELNEDNPIIYAEGGPNRYQTVTLFFPEEDGVRIEEDLDLHLFKVCYFTDEEEIELTEGALYNWALDYYENN